jgi:NAD(P)-dependent dehydrogenase (short-subunit alcohol dehydrogenase family)
MARPVLLLTGIAEGLGAAIAAAFARAGHDVIGLSRSDRAAEHITELVEQGGGRYTHLVLPATSRRQAKLPPRSNLLPARSTS